MEEYIGLDVSMKETAVSIRRDGKRIWRGKCASDPAVIADLLRKHAPSAKRVVFETGPLSVWFYHALCAEGLPAICIDARHAKAALDMAANKTDANDADGLAHLAEVGFYREVRVKGFDSMLTRTLVCSANQAGQDHDRAIQPNPRADEDLRVGRPRWQRQASSRSMSVRCWSIRRISPQSCCRSWRPGAACACVPPSSDGN